MIIHASITFQYPSHEVRIFDGIGTKTERFDNRANAVNYLISNDFKICTIQGKGYDSEMWFTKEDN